MTPNYILQYSYFSTLLNDYQRSFLLQQRGINIETNRQTLCREWETLEHSASLREVSEETQVEAKL